MIEPIANPGAGAPEFIVTELANAFEKYSVPPEIAENSPYPRITPQLPVGAGYVITQVLE